MLAIKHCISKTTHKHGIEIPTSVRHAHAINKKDGNAFFRDAIDKETQNVGTAFEMLPDDKSEMVGWKPTSGHMVLARLVSDISHKTPDLASQTNKVGMKAKQADKLEKKHSNYAEELAALQEDVELPVNIDTGGELDGHVIQLLDQLWLWAPRHIAFVSLRALQVWCCMHTLENLI